MKAEKKKSSYTFEIISKYRSILMGLAIISVIFFHFCDYRYHAEYGYRGMFGLYRFYWRNINGSAVDIFLVLSGLGLYYSWTKNPDYKSFITKRLSRILIPYLLIAVPALIWQNLFIKDLGVLSIFKDLFFISFVSDGNSWHWYILLIGILYVIFPFLYDSVNIKKNNIEIENYLIGCTVATIVLNLMLSIYAPNIFNNINLLTLRFPVFIFGIYIGRLSYNKEKIENKWIFLLFISLLSIHFINRHGMILRRLALGLVNFTVFMIIIQVFELLEQKNINFNILKKVLTFFGTYSLELYLSHVTINRFLNYFGIHTYKISGMLVLVVLSILLSLLIKNITEKIANIIDKKSNT